MKFLFLFALLSFTGNNQKCLINFIFIIIEENVNFK